MKIKLKYSRFFVLFGLLVILTISSVPIDRLLNNYLHTAGTTSPTFSGFSPSKTNDITPNVIIQVNDSESGLNVDSGYFAFTTNGSDPNEFCNPYRDDFNDNSIAGYWSYRNQVNGSFVESGSNLTISDLNGNHSWNADDRTAPFMYQTISGDVIAQAKVSVNFQNKGDIAGVLMCDENDDFIRMQYILIPRDGPNRYNVALRYSINGSDTATARFTVAIGSPVDEIWLQLIRAGDEFAGFYSLDGVDFDFLGFVTVPLTQLTDVGMFVGHNTNATFDDWEITPWIECTGINGTTDPETMTVHDVQFNQFSEDENKIKFNISDMNGNVAISSTYTVNITEIKGPVNFSEFQPIQTDVDNPAVQISIQDDINGIDKYTAHYAFSISGKEPVAFMNPYSDRFDDGIIQDCWEKINPLNGNLEESINGLNFTDIGDHTWNSTVQDAPYITQNIAGSFRVSVKMILIDLNENKTAGIIIILDELNALKLLIENKSGQVNVSFYYINGVSETLINEITPSQSSPIWLRIVRDSDEWTAQYSIDGDTYAAYYDVGSITITSWDGALGQPRYYAIPGAAAKVGLIVEHGASIRFQDWSPSPEIIVSGIDGSTAKELIQVSSVRFDEFSETNNIIRFSINSTNNERSVSPIYTVNCTSIYEFRDHTLLSDGGILKIVDGEKNTVWEWDEGAGEKEMLPNGNLLVVQFGGNVDANAIIKEINMTTFEVVWNISSVGDYPLNWTHDVDYLGFDENGDETYLIADTSNNRVVEFYRNGTVKWEWNATDHYTFGYSAEGDPLLENGWDWTHLNDADRLPDGSTMISLRNFDKVIIVNTTDTGDILWEYGEYGNYTLCNHIHNPQYTPRGTIIISDSDNQRIIEVNMTTKEIIWEYAPTGNEFLGWPRDADLLPNGNMLISDSAQNGGKNRIWEINTATKEVVWYFDTDGNNYEADRLDTVLPTIDFISPTNTTYGSSLEITISLQNNDPWYDDMWYRVYDETDGEWLSVENITYIVPTQMILKNKHTYTLYAWAEDVYMEEGAFPTSRAILQQASASLQFTIDLASEYDPSEPYPGNTLISHQLKEVSPEGEILWFYEPAGKITWDAERLPNGNYLFSICDDFHIDPNVTLVNNIIEMTPEYEVVWNYTIYGPKTGQHEIHDVDKLPNGNYLIADMSQDRVIEVNSTYDIVWEWKCIDDPNFLPLPDPIPFDWVHLNDVDRLPNGNTLMTLRNYDTVIEVNPAGDIVWQYGDLLFDVSINPNNHTILWGPHNADRLSNGHTMIADSLNDRILEVDMLGNVVWELNASHVDLNWPRDCDKLPNGNILIADSLNSRIIEVNSTYDIVWEYISSDSTYEADRIDIIAPTINVHSPLNIIYATNTVEVNITSPDLDTDTIWYKFWNVNSSDWVDLTPQGGETGDQIYENGLDSWVLEDGEYILYVWANDTGYPMLGSDQDINIREVQVNFRIGLGILIASPYQYQFFGNTTFNFEILVTLEGVLNTTWYTLGVGQENITFTGLTGKIEQAEWDKFSNGTVLVTFFVNDSDGNKFTKSITVQKDTIPPITSIIYTPFSDINNVIESTPFMLTSTDIFGSGAGIIRYSVDNITWVDYVDPFYFTNYSLGSHIIYYYAIDNVNNTESIKSITINLVEVKHDGNDPNIVFPIVISISSVAVAGGVIFYFLRKRMIVQDENKP